MSIIFKKDTNEFVLEREYEINTVSLEQTATEHTHQFIELVYTLTGKGIHKVDEREYHVKSGDMLVINYHCHHTVVPVENLCYVDIMLKPEYVNETLKGTDDFFLMLRLSNFSDLSNRIIKDNLLLHFEGEEKKKIEFLLNWTCKEQKEQAPASDLVMYSALSMILSLVFRKMTENQNTRLALNDNLLYYIRQNCCNKLLINEIALKCGYTMEHFSRIFKKYTGKTPVAYINDCRISCAKSLLVTTDAPVEAIISECGFSNRTAFFKKFHACVGMTPLQFRKNQK